MFFEDLVNKLGRNNKSDFIGRITGCKENKITRQVSSVLLTGFSEDINDFEWVNNITDLELT